MASGWIQQAFKYIRNTCEKFSSILSSSLSQQAYSCMAFLFTTHFFFASSFFSTLDRDQQVLVSLFFLVNAMLLLKLPINLQDTMKDLSLGNHVMLKSVVGFGSYLIFNRAGTSMALHEDVNLMTSSFGYLMYLLTLEARFHFEEELGLCEGFLFARNDLMMNQNVIPSWIVVIVGLTSLTIKFYIQMFYSKKYVSLKFKGPVVEPVFAKFLPYSRYLGYIGLSFATHFFFVSSYFADLTHTQQVFTYIFFFITWLLMLKFPPLLIQLEGGVKLVYQAMLKAVLSFGFRCVFQWIGRSVKFSEDVNLMYCFLAFMIYLLSLESRYHLGDTVTLCEGFLFAGYGVMMTQKIIPTSIVILVGPAMLLAKNYIQMSWNQQSLAGNGTPPEAADK